MDSLVEDGDEIVAVRVIELDEMTLGSDLRQSGMTFTHFRQPGDSSGEW